MKKNKLIAYFLLFSIGVVFLAKPYFSAFAEASSQINTGTVLTVGKDAKYTTIQSAIDAAADNDTIYIKKGVYREAIYIEKSLTIQGEDRDSTIITSDQTTTVDIEGTDTVCVKEITVIAGSPGDYYPGYGISVSNVKSVTISGCKVTGIAGVTGIQIYSYTKNSIISDCEVFSLGGGTGISVGSDSSEIKNCKVYGNKIGISVAPDKYVLIENNEIYSNSDTGCYIMANGADYLCTKNKIYNNEIGISANYTKLDSDGQETGKIIDNELFYNTSFGIEIFNCSGLIVDSNYIYTSNEASSIDSCGIYTGYVYSEKNTITNNIIENYPLGIYLNQYVLQHYIYQNDFISNAVQAKDLSSNTLWDYNSKGNYWSDYSGNGSVSYIINSKTNVMDNFPSTARSRNISAPSPIPTPTSTPTVASTSTSTPTPTNAGNILPVGEKEKFTTIQSAIDAADDNDTIYIKKGVYKESIYINKSLTLHGEDMDSTVITTDYMAINIDGADNINIKDITITTYSQDSGSFGIYMNNVKSSFISHCKVVGFSDGTGTGIEQESNIGKSIISDCQIFGNSYGICTSSDSIEIRNCKVYLNEYGINVPTSNYSSIENNEVYSNEFIAISIHENQSFLSIKDNAIYNNKSAISLEKVNSSNEDKKNWNISKNKIFFNSYYGIYLYYSCGLTIDENYIYTSKEISSSSSYGICTYLVSERNTISNNTIENYGIGISLEEYVVGYNINHNDFINNSIQSEDKSKNNTWDSNYWSDYTVGSISTSYIVNPNPLVRDNHPLTARNSNVSAPTPIPTATATPIPVSTPAATPTATLNSVPAASNTSTPTAIPSSAPVNSTNIDPQQIIPAVLTEQSPTHTSTPTAIATITPTATPIATGTITASPTPTPRPTKSVVLNDIGNHWGKDYIRYVVSLGIMDSKKNGIFAPNDYTTRAECAKALIMLVDKLNSTHRSSYYKDVPVKNPYYLYIMSAFDEKIMIGNGDGTFRPDSMITRQDLVVTLSKTLTKYYTFRPIKASNNKKSASSNEKSDNADSKGTLSLPFKDTGRISSYALDGVATAVNYGLITGKNGNLFDPKGNTTRAELATIITKLIKKYGFPN